MRDPNDDWANWPTGQLATGPKRSAEIFFLSLQGEARVRV